MKRSYIGFFFSTLSMVVAGCGTDGAISVSCGPGTIQEGDTCVAISGSGGGSSSSSSAGGQGGEGGQGGSSVCGADGAQQSCYGGLPGTQDVGVCHAGTQTCAGGKWGPCLGAVIPKAETCDGIDDDCDGTADDGLGTLSCGVGQCATTTPACVNGTPQICNSGPPVPEICDGLDNNCDGTVDEGNPGASQACNTGFSGACSLGTTACVSGVLVCNQTAAPTVETCNGVDDNCNGIADDNTAGVNQTCTTGKLGLCAAGKTACTAGAVACVQTTAASPETCNQLDDDCDGIADNGNPGGGEACSTGQFGACAAGTISCVSGSLVCKAISTPLTELCNGLDDDCDGAVDESTSGSNQSCNTGKLGVCAAGKTACTAGAMACVQTTLASPEICNQLDDDCDGTIDDGNPGGGQSCSTGQIGACAAGTISCVSGALTCTSNYMPSVEVCNQLDDDCNGDVDDYPLGANIGCNTGLAGPCSSGSMECVAGQFTCSQNVQPSTDTCDGLDNDCSGVTDDGCMTTCDPIGLVPGKLSIGPSGGLVPLCGGEVLVGHSLLNRLERYNVVTKALVATYQLNASPGDIAYDAPTNTAYVALGVQSQIVKVNIGTGVMTTIPLTAPASRLAIGNGNIVLATHTNNTLSVINGATATLLATRSLGFGYAGNLIAYDKPSDLIFLGRSGGTTLGMSYFDAATLAVIPLQYGDMALANCNTVATSPAGGHVAYACGPGNGSSYSYAIFDYSSYDLSVTSGSWNTTAYPNGAAFSRDGKRFLGSSGTHMKLFDTLTHAQLKTWSVSYCQYGSITSVAMSPGGTIAYGYTSCGFNKDSGEVYWFIP